MPPVGTYSLLRFLRAFVKGKHSFSSLPSHPNFARFYRYASIFFFGSYVLFCLTSLTAVHLICGLAVSLRVHSFVLFILEICFVSTQRKPNLIKATILLYAVTEPRSSICTHLYSHVYGLCFTPFFYLWFFGSSESDFISMCVTLSVMLYAVWR